MTFAGPHEDAVAEGFANVNPTYSHASFWICDPVRMLNTKGISGLRHEIGQQKYWFWPPPKN